MSGKIQFSSCFGSKKFQNLIFVIKIGLKRLDLQKNHPEINFLTPLIFFKINLGHFVIYMTFDSFNDKMYIKNTAKYPENSICKCKTLPELKNTPMPKT